MNIVGVQLSTSENPTTFQDFSQAVPYFQVNGEGSFCFPVDFVAAGISGVQDGSNVTIQLIFDGGDGQLYQVRYTAYASSRMFPLIADFYSAQISLSAAQLRQHRRLALTVPMRLATLL